MFKIILALLASTLLLVPTVFGANVDASDPYISTSDSAKSSYYSSYATPSYSYSSSYSDYSRYSVPTSRYYDYVSPAYPYGYSYYYWPYYYPTVRVSYSTVGASVSQNCFSPFGANSETKLIDGAYYKCTRGDWSFVSYPRTAVGFPVRGDSTVVVSGVASTSPSKEAWYRNRG